MTEACRRDTSIHVKSGKIKKGIRFLVEIRIRDGQIIVPLGSTGNIHEGVTVAASSHKARAIPLPGLE